MATRHDKRGYVFLGTVDAAALISSVRLQAPIHRDRLIARTAPAQRAQQIADRKGADNTRKGTAKASSSPPGTEPPSSRATSTAPSRPCPSGPAVRKVRFHDLRHTCASLPHEQARMTA